MWVGDNSRTLEPFLRVFGWCFELRLAAPFLLRAQHPEATQTIHPPLHNPKGIGITQPRVARNELPWVTVQRREPTLKGFHQMFPTARFTFSPHHGHNGRD